ncbi:hypothetical protein JCM15519_13260 [Fundidesulfovibrio butyratiphilus]
MGSPRFAAEEGAGRPRVRIPSGGGNRIRFHGCDFGFDPAGKLHADRAKTYTRPCALARRPGAPGRPSRRGLGGVWNRRDATPMRQALRLSIVAEAKRVAAGGDGLVFMQKMVLCMHGADYGFGAEKEKNVHISNCCV